MLAALTLCTSLLIQGQTSEPAPEFGTRTVAQWIEESRGGARQLDALWGLYHAGERSSEVVATLQQALGATHAVPNRCAADTILCHWRIAHELLPAEVYARGFPLAERGQRLLPIVRPLRDPTLARRVLLTSPDERVRAEAAVGMLADREDAGLALREILSLGEPGASEQTPRRRRLQPSEIESIRRWARDYAGSAYFDAVGQSLFEAADVAQSLAQHPDWRRQLESEAAGRAAALSWLKRTAAERPEAAPLLRPLIAGLLDSWLEPSLERDDEALWRSRARHLSSWRPKLELVDPFLEAHYAERARAILAGATASSTELAWLQVAALRYPAVARLCLQALPAWLERGDALAGEVSRTLGRLGSDDARAREAYLLSLRGWVELDAESLQSLPFWKRHDEETRAAFLDLLARVPEPKDVYEQALFAGELDASNSEIARTLIERTQGRDYRFVFDGFRGLVAVDESGSRADQISQLALNLATKQARGEDFAEEERRMVAILDLPYDSGGAGGADDQVQQAFFQAQTLGLHSPGMLRVARDYIELGPPYRGDLPMGFSTHSDAASDYLESLPVELEQVPRLRRALFRGEPDAWSRLLRATPMTAREEAYLLLELGSASVERRLRLIELLEEFRIDGSKVMACLTELAERDLDLSVRRSAERLLAARVARVAAGRDGVGPRRTKRSRSRRSGLTKSRSAPPLERRIG